MRLLLLCGALAAAGLACRPADPEAAGPKPAMNQRGSRWDVSRGERTVFSMTNEPGKVEWGKTSDDHPFLNAELFDTREEARLRELLRKSRHFRDFVQRLDTAGYRVTPSS